YSRRIACRTDQETGTVTTGEVITSRPSIGITPPCPNSTPCGRASQGTKAHRRGPKVPAARPGTGDGPARRRGRPPGLARGREPPAGPRLGTGARRCGGRRTRDVRGTGGDLG